MTARRGEENFEPLLPPSSPPPPPPPPPHPPPPPPPPHPPPPYYVIPAFVLLPPYPFPRRRCCGLLFYVTCLLALVLAAILLAAAAYFLWPSDPDLQVSHLRLDRIHISRPPGAALDVSLGLEARVRNPDFFAIDYGSLMVSVGYRGQRLGTVTSIGWHVRARGSSYVDAELRLDGIQFLDDASNLIEDLSRGSLLLDTVAELRGKLRIFFFEALVKGRVSCSVNVNPENEKIIHQDCYPE